MFRKMVLVAAVALSLLAPLSGSAPLAGAARAAVPGREGPPGPNQLWWEIIGHHPRYAPFGKPTVVERFYGSESDAQDEVDKWNANAADGWSCAYHKAR